MVLQKQSHEIEKKLRIFLETDLLAEIPLGKTHLRKRWQAERITLLCNPEG